MKKFEEMTLDEILNLKVGAIKQRTYVAFGEIVEHLGEDTNYPEDSVERELWDRYITEKMVRADGKHHEPQEYRLKIPRMTESPTATAKMTRRWLNDFYG